MNPPLAAVGVLAVAFWVGVANSPVGGAEVTSAGSATTPPTSSANVSLPLAQPAKGLIYPQGPAKGSQIVFEAVKHLLSDNYTPIVGVKVELPLPLPIYTSRNLLTSGTLDTQESLSQFYYPLKDSGKLIATVTVMVDATTGDARLGSIGLNPPTLITDALDQAAKLPQVQAGSYEPRLLNFTWEGTLGRVLWLKSLSDENDLIYIFGALFRANLQVQKLYTVPEFLAEAQATQQRSQAASQLISDQQSAVFAESGQNSSNGKDTATTRLEALKATLDSAVAIIKQMPAEAQDSLLKKPLADIVRTQGDVTRGLEYVKAHPDGNLLSPSVKGEAFSGWSPDSLGQIYTAEKARAAEPLLEVDGPLRKSLNDFIGNPGVGRPIIGDIGGYRDAIMREVAVAVVDTESQAFNFPPLRLLPVQAAAGTVPSGPSALANNTTAPDQLGSISGSIVHPESATPDAFAVILVREVGAHGVPDADMLRSAIPATVADKNGNFLIKNLRPGFYILDGNPWHGADAVLKVMAGSETKLPVQLISRPIPQIGGGN